ncbi:hypothetical protein [Arthrobacter zhaoguopingii]|uniref:hypothetical protein n=1 Tax=Arthrobacter zhaoguopingii TaxID=2681491 RepID=UPI001358F0F8|nr:hypothetical protein [Arthrobacter zhaoguopingii]
MPEPTQPQGEASGLTRAGDLPRLIGQEDMAAERLRAIEEFPEELPDGFSWSTEPVGAGKDVVIEEGVEDVAVAEYWLCAWMAEYLGAVDSGDVVGEDAAMVEIGKYTSLPIIKAMHQNPEAFEASVVETARRGEPANLRAFFKSCGAQMTAATR